MLFAEILARAKLFVSIITLLHFLLLLTLTGEPQEPPSPTIALDSLQLRIDRWLPPSSSPPSTPPALVTRGQPKPPPDRPDSKLRPGMPHNLLGPGPGLAPEALSRGDDGVGAGCAGVGECVLTGERGGGAPEEVQSSQSVEGADAAPGSGGGGRGSGGGSIGGGDGVGVEDVHHTKHAAVDKGEDVTRDGFAVIVIHCERGCECGCECGGGTVCCYVKYVGM